MGRNYANSWCFGSHSQEKGNGGSIISASYKPGDPSHNWGIKLNYSSGQLAPESITDQIYGNTLSISEIKMADMPDIDWSSIGVKTYGSFSVEAVDPVADYLELMEMVFDFQLIKDLLSRPDFRFIFDAMHAVTGAYAKPIFVDQLGASLSCIMNGVPLEDFGHGHPDPNLTLQEKMAPSRGVQLYMRKQVALTRAALIGLDGLGKTNIYL